MVRLNRAVAVWHVSGAEAALLEADALLPQLRRYHLLHSTRGELLRELGREEEAQDEEKGDHVRFPHAAWAKTAATASWVTPRWSARRAAWRVNRVIG